MVYSMGKPLDPWHTGKYLGSNKHVYITLWSQFFTVTKTIKLAF